MFVGDSIAYGTSRADQSRMFTELLRRDLPSIVNQPVEVLDAAASGWAIDNELSYIRSRGTFQSDIVLMVLNSGDLAQPRATMADVGDELPVKREATAIGEVYDRYIKPRLFRIQKRADAGDGANENADNVVRANLDDLEVFRSLVAAQNSRLVIVYAPFRKGIPAGIAPSAATLRNWAAERQVPLLDMTSAEMAFTAREITLDGIHFNEAGHRVVAEAIERSWSGVIEQQGQLRQ